MSHPNIAALYEIGDDGGPFLVYEFVPGQTLATLVAGGPLNPRRAVDLATQMADALAEAHAAGIAHGAITTDAVIVTPKGPAKILDFGLTAWTNGHGPSTSGSVAEDRADIEALGAILFEMLTGHAATSGPLTPSAANRLCSARARSDCHEGVRPKRRQPLRFRGHDGSRPANGGSGTRAAVVDCGAVSRRHSSPEPFTGNLGGRRTVPVCARGSRGVVVAMTTSGLSRRRISASPVVKADRAMTSSMPA